MPSAQLTKLAQRVLRVFNSNNLSNKLYHTQKPAARISEKLGAFGPSNVRNLPTMPPRGSDKVPSGDGDTVQRCGVTHMVGYENTEFVAVLSLEMKEA